MQFDFEDILASSVGRVVAIALFFVCGIWIGSVIGGFALMVGMRDLPAATDVSWAPLLLINLWLVLNVAFLAAMMIWVFVADGLGYLAWGILVGAESLFVLLGHSFGFGSRDFTETLVAWGVWLILLVMLETGVWLVCQWRRNIWARQLAELRAENAMIRAEREQLARETEVPEDTDLR